MLLEGAGDDVRATAQTFRKSGRERQQAHGRAFSVESQFDERIQSERDRGGIEVCCYNFVADVENSRILVNEILTKVDFAVTSPISFQGPDGLLSALTRILVNRGDGAARTRLCDAKRGFADLDVLPRIFLV